VKRQEMMIAYDNANNVQTFEEWCEANGRNVYDQTSPIHDVAQWKRDCAGYEQYTVKERGTLTAYLVSYGFDLKFAEECNQRPYFSITVEYWTAYADEVGPTTLTEYEAKHGKGRVTKRRENASGGAAHDVIREQFPHLANAIRWHLADNSGTPMHYVANALYWHDHIGDDPKYTDDYGVGEAEIIRRLRSTMVWGCLPGEEAEQGAGPEAMGRKFLQSYLNMRHPKLLDAMVTDLEAVGVEVIEKAGGE